MYIITPEEKEPSLLFCDIENGEFFTCVEIQNVFQKLNNKQYIRWYEDGRFTDPISAMHLMNEQIYRLTVVKGAEFVVEKP